VVSSICGWYGNTLTLPASFMWDRSIQTNNTLTSSVN